MTSNAENFSSLSKIQKVQHFTRRRYQAVDNAYYSLIDELQQKLTDLGEIDEKSLSNLEFYTFSFIKDWQAGIFDTSYVCDILQSMNFRDIAEKQLTRRLNNLLRTYENKAPQSCDYIKVIRDKMLKEVLPLYESYLNMLKKYFEKMVEVDQSQVPLVWLEEIIMSNNDIRIQVKDISLNQTFRDLETNVIPRNNRKYTVGDNVIVFNEDLQNNDIACHWIFGPKQYVILLKEKFNVVEKINMTEEKDYLKKLISGYVK